MPPAAPKSPTGRTIFLYGSLMRGFPAHSRFAIPRRASFLGPGRVAGRLISLGPYPGLVEDPSAVTVGEVYRVKDPGLIVDLDRFEEFDPARPHLSAYIRVAASLLDDGRPVQLYRYNRAVGGHPAVPEGDWRQFVRRQSGRIS